MTKKSDILKKKKLYFFTFNGTVQDISFDILKI